MKIGDLVRKTGLSGRVLLGTIIRKHNEHYCNVLWLNGHREWLITQNLEVICK